MNYYVDIHANLLTGLAGLGGGKLTGSEAEARYDPAAAREYAEYMLARIGERAEKPE